MTTDRHEQAGAHAEARTQTWTDPHSEYADGYVSGHMAGVEWADANHPAVEALARVRGLHRPVESQWGDQACAECLNSWELEVVWPCATWKATEVVDDE